jgi:exonuclease VII large subunit
MDHLVHITFEEFDQKLNEYGEYSRKHKKQIPPLPTVSSAPKK